MGVTYRIDTISVEFVKVAKLAAERREQREAINQ